MPLADVEEAVFDEDGEEYDDDWFEVECPSCGADIMVDDEALADGEVQRICSSYMRHNTTILVLAQ